MKLKEQIKKDIETLKNIPTNERKLAYVAEYYGVAILTIIVVLAIAITSTVKAFTKDEVILYTVLVNSDAIVVDVDDTIFSSILHDAGIEMKKKKVDVNTDLYLGINQNEEEDVRTLQVLTALFMISDLDVYVSDKESFSIFANENAFANLSALIDQTTLNRYQNNLYTVQNENGEEYAVGIILHDSLLHKAGYYHDDVVIGIANNAVNFDNALDFVNQLLK